MTVLEIPTSNGSGGDFPPIGPDEYGGGHEGYENSPEQFAQRIHLLQKLGNLAATVAIAIFHFSPSEIERHRTDFRPTTSE